MSGDDIGIMAIAFLVIVGIAVFVRGLSPAPRIVVLVGSLVGAAQVFFPLCLGPGRPPDYRSEPMGRHVSPMTYDPSDSGGWIDQNRLMAGLAVTGVAAAIVSGLIQWHLRTGRAEVSRVRPTH